MLWSSAPFRVQQKTTRRFLVRLVSIETRMQAGTCQNTHFERYSSVVSVFNTNICESAPATQAVPTSTFPPDLHLDFPVHDSPLKACTERHPVMHKVSTKVKSRLDSSCILIWCTTFSLSQSSATDIHENRNLARILSDAKP